MNTIGSLILDLQGTDISPEERDLLFHPLVGGVILFSRNFSSREQLTALCQAIRASRKLPLLIMADQEGGRVQRFKDGFSKLPPMAHFGALYDTNPADAFQQTEDCGYLMASELVASGVDLSLSPVLDLHKGVSSVIGDRAFHAQPEVVSLLAQAFIRGMNKAGMAAVGKHFPGHGSVTLDSHVAMPTDTRTMVDIESDDLRSFLALIQQDIPAIMAAHITFPQIDHLPVSYSAIWLRDVLRKRLKFNGTLFSDDLNMEGANISSNYADRVTAAREAGCDFALLCNNRSGVIQALDNVNQALHQVEEPRWGRLLARSI